MKRIIALVLLALVITPSVFAAEWSKMIVPFTLGTTIAASETNSAVFRIPQAAKIESIYLTDRLGAASSTTDYLEVKFYLNDSAYGTFTSSGTTIVAVTPIAITPTASVLAAGDVVQFKLTKTGSGAITTDMGITMTIYGSTSE